MEEPQAREYEVGEVKLVVQVEEQTCEGVTLRLLEDGEETASASKEQSSRIGHCVDKE